MSDLSNEKLDELAALSRLADSGQIEINGESVRGGKVEVPPATLLALVEELRRRRAEASRPSGLDLSMKWNPNA